MPCLNISYVRIFSTNHTCNRIQTFHFFLPLPNTRYIIFRKWIPMRLAHRPPNQSPRAKSVKPRPIRMRLQCQRDGKLYRIRVQSPWELGKEFENQPVMLAAILLTWLMCGHHQRRELIAPGSSIFDNVITSTAAVKV